jgi:hypothetical protein
MHDSFERPVADGRSHAGRVVVWQALAEPMSLSSSLLLRRSCQVADGTVDWAVSIYRMYCTSSLATATTINLNLSIYDPTCRQCPRSGALHITSSL